MCRTSPPVGACESATLTRGVPAAHQSRERDGEHSDEDRDQTDGRVRVLDVGNVLDVFGAHGVGVVGDGTGCVLGGRIFDRVRDGLDRLIGVGIARRLVRTGSDDVRRCLVAGFGDGVGGVVLDRRSVLRRSFWCILHGEPGLVDDRPLGLLGLHRDDGLLGLHRDDGLLGLHRSGRSVVPGGHVLYGHAVGLRVAHNPRGGVLALRQHPSATLGSLDVRGGRADTAIVVLLHRGDGEQDTNLAASVGEVLDVDRVDTSGVHQRTGQAHDLQAVRRCTDVLTDDGACCVVADARVDDQDDTSVNPSLLLDVGVVLDVVPGTELFGPGIDGRDVRVLCGLRHRVDTRHQVSP